MTRRWIGVVAAVALGAATLSLGVRAYSLRAANDDSKVTRLEEELERLQAQVDTLGRREPKVIYLERPGPAPHLSPTDSTSTDPVANADEADANTPEASERRVEKFAEALDRRVSQEPVDRNWRAEALQAIQSSIRALEPATSLVDATCASTLCRVVVSHATAADQRALATAIAEQPPFDSGTHYVRNLTEDESLTTTLYVVRTGHDVKDEAEEARN